MDRAIDRERWPYRMKDLCELTGLDRQTVHFYIAKGLVPEGHKTGRNMAYYGAEHLERIRLIRELQHQRFLPLDAIRAVLDGEDAGFTHEQKAMLVEVKDRVADVLRDAREPTRPLLPLAGLLRTHAVSIEDIDRLVELGLLALVEVEGELHLPEHDVWLVELWGSLRAAGFSEALGFRVEDLAMYAEAIGELFRREIRSLVPRLAALPAERAAELFRRGLPLINSFLVRYHTAKARQFFTAIG
ncbi:MerR family transcriptional regulator [Nannocystaceae bacterium ST9]